MTPLAAQALLAAADSAPLAYAVRASELAKRTNVSLRDVLAAANVGGHLSADAVISAELEIKYSGYFEKERTRAARLTAMSEFALPADADYMAMHALSTEARVKLTERRPASLGIAAQIPGISPSDLQNLVMTVRKAGWTD